MSEKQEEPHVDDSDELKELVQSLNRIERERTRKTALITALLIVIGAIGLGSAYIYRQALFVPELHIEAGEKEILAETNDPQCRGFVAEVTQIGLDLKALDPKLVKGLLSEDPEVVRSLQVEVKGLSTRLTGAQAHLQDANLRYEQSAQELEDWFAHIQGELRIMDSVAENRLAALEPAAPDPVAGTLVEFEDSKPKKPKGQRPPQERLERALLTADDAFEGFRVWHSASLHPCGKASADETPWSPEQVVIP